MTENQASRTLIADRLKSARMQAGLSQGQVAVLLDMHRPSVSEIEAGRRRVSAEEIARFADIYGVSVSWLVGQESDRENPAVELAARELAKLRKEDLDRVVRLLRTLRKEPKGRG